MIRSSPTSLSGFAVGVSGAVPERSDWTHPATDRDILDFVSVFSALVFKHGGRIVHGAQPTFTPLIVRQAAQHASSWTDCKPITLVVSELWAESWANEQVARYEQVADLMIIRKVGEGGAEDTETRNKSLSLMRKHLIENMNVLVAVGGKLHRSGGAVPGVDEELGLAISSGMACFLIGGLGGRAYEIAERKDVMEQLHNELPADEHERLLRGEVVSDLPGTLIDHLISHPELCHRRLDLPAVDRHDCIAY